eukprot:15458360-Alexandrium_andersonii.AAC.1
MSGIKDLLPWGNWPSAQGSPQMPSDWLLYWPRGATLHHRWVYVMGRWPRKAASEQQDSGVCRLRAVERAIWSAGRALTTTSEGGFGTKMPNADHRARGPCGCSDPGVLLLSDCSLQS